MGTLVDKEIDRGNFGVSSTKSVGDSLLYQLVRVEGDGRLVPATDEEVMEVEHLLEEYKSELPMVNDKIDAEGCISTEDLSSRKSELDGSEGLSQLESSKASLQALNIRVEEEALQFSGESLNSSTKSMVVEGELSKHHKHSLSGDDKFKPENSLLETVPRSVPLKESQSAETYLEPAKKEASHRSSISETCSSSMPDFSLIKGEICLDNYTIRELQEAFRATFGRETTVKDKLWLKRRIAMGLTNSCEVPDTRFVIKDNKIINEDVKEAPCTVRRSRSEDGSIVNYEATASKMHECQDPPVSPISQIADRQVLAGKRLEKPELEFDATQDDFHMDTFAAKRVRKPTRRYIEELSDVETRECTGRPISCIRSSRHDQSSPKTRIRPVCDTGSQEFSFATRLDSLGGSGIRIPHVSRVRRGYPRKNFMSLVNFVGLGREEGKKELTRTEEPRKELEMASGHESDDYDDIMPTVKSGIKRKHHRAWTLGEVLKLVEGVARYGAGRWSEIRRLAFASHTSRTSVDLKDKWRNLLRASFAQEPTEKGQAKNFRKQSSVPIPTPILSRVRELAEMHYSQAGIRFSHSGKFARHSKKTTPGKGTGFL